MKKIPAIPEPDPPELLALRKAMPGLLYPSESDVPFDVFRWEESGSTQSTAKDVIAFHVDKDRPIEELPVEQFFSDIAIPPGSRKTQRIAADTAQPVNRLTDLPGRRRRTQGGYLSARPNRGWRLGRTSYDFRRDLKARRKFITGLMRLPRSAYPLRYGLLAELADAMDSKSIARKGVSVRLR